METQAAQPEGPQTGPNKPAADSGDEENEVFFSVSAEDPDTPDDKTSLAEAVTDGQAETAQVEPEDSLCLMLPATQEDPGTQDDSQELLVNSENSGTSTAQTGKPDKISEGDTCHACNASCRSSFLRCSKCNGRTHYICTRLPSYQITNLIGHRRVYTCEQCTKPRQDVEDILNSRNSDVTRPDDPVSQDVLDSNTVQLAKVSEVIAVTERIDRLEASMVELVRGLYQDVTDSRAEQLMSDLKASKAENSLMSKKLDEHKRKCHEMELKMKQQEAEVQKQEKEHTEVAACECNGTYRETLAQNLQLEEQVHKQEDEMLSMKRIIAELQADMRKRNEENEELRDSSLKNTERIAELDALLIKREEALTEANNHARTLELQCEEANNKDKTQWTVIPKHPVSVKGVDDPLSNFFPCKFTTYNAEFETVEHAFQYRKLFDHNMFDDAETVRKIECPIQAKQKAAELLGRTKNLKWEEKSFDILRHLLAIKKDVSPRFRQELEASKGRELRHNVACPFWGTGGKHGGGQNRFGHLLMELREKWFAANVNTEVDKGTNKTEKSSATSPGQNRQASNIRVHEKPHLMIIGNSITKGIHADKLCKDLHTSKRWAATIGEARTVIDHLDEKPKIVLFQLTTNDVKGKDPASVTASYKELVEGTTTKLPDTKIILSSAPVCDNTTKIAADIFMVNASLENAYHDSGITCIRNRDITAFHKDGLHPLRGGVSRLAGNIKATVCSLLQIPNTSRPRQHGQSGLAHRHGPTEWTPNAGQTGNQRHSTTETRGSTAGHTAERTNCWNAPGCYSCEHSNCGGYSDSPALVTLHG